MQEWNVQAPLSPLGDSVQKSWHPSTLQGQGQGKTKKGSHHSGNKQLLYGMLADLVQTSWASLFPQGRASAGGGGKTCPLVPCE